MTSYGMNPQGGQMAPLDLEVAETCALGHMGGVLTVFGRSDSSTCAETRGQYSQGVGSARCALQPLATTVA